MKEIERFLKKILKNIYLKNNKIQKVGFFVGPKENFFILKKKQSVEVTVFDYRTEDLT